MVDRRDNILLALEKLAGSQSLKRSVQMYKTSSVRRGYFQKRSSLLEKLANIVIKNPALQQAISAAKNKNFTSAASTLLTNKPARQEALQVAQRLKSQGKLDKLPDLKKSVPEQMPGMFGLPKLSKNVLGTIAKNRGNASFKAELRSILDQLGGV